MCLRASVVPLANLAPRVVHFLCRSHAERYATSLCTVFANRPHNLFRSGPSSPPLGGYIGSKQRYTLGPIDDARVAFGEEMFQASAKILEAHLKGRDFLLNSGLTYVDFRMATFLPFNDVAGQPMADCPSILQWYERLSLIPEWAYPFSGLAAPDLPIVARSRRRLDNPTPSVRLLCLQRKPPFRGLGIPITGAQFDRRKACLVGRIWPILGLNRQ
jgi:hypothetical protein